MDDADGVLNLERTWAIAPRTGDLETVNRVTADDWIAVAPDGQTMNKRDLLEMLASRPSPFERTDYSDIKVSLFGTTAVVTSFFQGTGKELTLNQHFMRVYAKRDGSWRCVATQIIPVSAEPRV